MVPPACGNTPRSERAGTELFVVVISKWLDCVLQERRVNELKREGGRRRVRDGEKEGERERERRERDTERHTVFVFRANTDGDDVLHLL